MNDLVDDLLYWVYHDASVGILFILLIVSFTVTLVYGACLLIEPIGVQGLAEVTVFQLVFFVLVWSAMISIIKIGIGLIVGIIKGVLV